MALNPKLKDWHGRIVWVLGASSGIGRATAHALHARGAVVVVSARNEEALRAFELEHPGAIALPLDASDAIAVTRAARLITAQYGPLDLAIYCVGHYRALRATEFDLAEMLKHQQVNYVGALNMLNAILPGMLTARSGHISLVASVAGYRGLPNSLAYGPTKAALQHLADALYLDLHAIGLGVSIINPGFVATPLTQQNDFHMPALITPDDAALRILRGWERGQFEIHFPKRFTLWLKALSHLGHAMYFTAIRKVTGAA